MGVRRESVQLDVHGNFVGEMTAAAISVAALRRELNGLGGMMRSNLSVSQQTQQRVATLTRVMNQNTTAAQRQSQSINQLTGRLGLAVDAALALGPAAIPIASQLTPAVSGLAMAAASAALAGGSMLVAFQGVGDAIKAVNEAALDPTSANLAKAEQAFNDLTPAARTFVAEFQQARPVFKEIRDAAAAGWFPGLTQALGSVESMAPRIADLLQTIGETGGAIVADGAESLAGPRWAQFIDFLGAEVPDAMTTLATSTGALTHGLAELLMSSEAGSDSFLAWVESVATSFDDWASSAEGRADVEAFLAYAAEQGPKVAEFVGSLGDLFVAVVRAAQPVGDVVLPILTALSDAVGVIASSDMATPILAAIIAMRTLSRLTAAQAALQRRAVAVVGPQGAAAARGATMGPQAMVAGAAARISNASTAQRLSVGAGIAGFAALSTGLADSIGAANTAMGAMIGSIAGPWGAAIGTAIGATMDLAKANDDLAASLERGKSLTLDSSLADIKAAREEIAGNLRDLAEADGFMGGLRRGISFLSGDIGEAEQLDKQYDALEAGIRSLRREAAATDPTVDGLASSFTQLYGELVLATNAWDDFTDASKAALGFLDRQQALLNYKDAIAAARDSIKEFGQIGTTNYDRLSADGRKVYDSLLDIARGGLQAAEGLTGVQRGRFLDGLVSDFRRTAEAAGLPQGAINNLLRQLGLVKTVKVKPEVDVDTSRADKKNRDLMADLDAIAGTRAEPTVEVQDRASGLLGLVQRTLNAIDGRTATATIVTRRIGTATPRQVDAAESADGGTVPKTGKPYADRHLYLLADGEEVISNRRGQADRYRSLLKAINAGRLADGGTVGRLANGGTTGRGGSDPVATVELFANALRASTDLLAKETRARNEALRRARDEQRAQLQSIRSQKASLASAVAGGLTGSVFGTLSTGSLIPDIGTRASTGAGMAKAEVRERSKLLSQLASRGMPLRLLSELGREATTEDLRALAGYSSGALTSFTREFEDNVDRSTAGGAIRSSLDDARRFLKALRRLRGLGLRGRALADAASNATADELEGLIAEGRAGVGEYVDLFNERERIAQQAGQFAGGQVYDARIAQQVAELQAANRLLAESNRALRDIEREVKRSGDRADKAADKIAREQRATANELRGVADAPRGRR
ncbi:hypothetical protein [Nocardioides sp.]|uniref:hypothetical protein n=1 Tax=Nocardioides sp. TaxID=35761 RepID=UPI003519BF4F